MTPTFQLAVGVPGSSSALSVARRFGMPSTVLERAERFLTREERSFEAVVQKLHDERAALALARTAAEQREREAREASARLEAELTAARARGRRALSDEAGELLDRLRRAREDLRAAQARLRVKKIEPEALREAERAIDRVGAEVALGGALERLVSPPEEAPRAPVQGVDLRKGARVWVPRLRAEAEVIDVLSGDQVRVSAGPLKLTVPAGELRAAAPATSEGPARGSMGASSGPARAARRVSPVGRSALAHGPDSGEAERIPPATRDATCDLRGLRVDDALAMAMTFLDRAVHDGHEVVHLLHGHGTGALREAIRGELARSAYVARFRGGDVGQGGDGVTVVWLA
jgi:DNA mismatch repair protein MutS2